MSDFQSEYHYNQYEVDSKNIQTIISTNVNAQNILIQPVTYPNFENENYYNEDQVQIPQQNINTQPNQAINQPLVVIYVPIICNYDDLKAQKIIFLQEINRLLIYQQIFQVLLLLAFEYFGVISDILQTILFDDDNEYNLRLYFQTLITLLFLLTVRCNQQLRQMENNKFIYKFHFVIYSLFSIRVFQIFNFMLYRIVFRISFANLIQLISIQFQLLNMKDQHLKFSIFLIKSCYCVFFMILIGFSLDRNYYYYDDQYEYLALLSNLQPFIFTAFYIPSLIQVYNGKFKLKLKQQHIGSVLVHINMFMLCIPD